MGVLEFWKRIFDFGGTSTRTEFWVGYLVNVFLLAMTAFNLLACGGTVTGTIGVFFLVLLFLMFYIGLLSATCRRLRDAGFSPWLAALRFIPFPFAPLALLVLTLFPAKTSYSKNELKSLYNPATMKPVLKCSICNGEQTAGFKDLHTGEFHDIMLIQSEKDLEDFKKLYHIQGEIEKQY